MIHGGDIYTNKIEYDFSVNINPLMPPQEMILELREALSDITAYPDIKCLALRSRLAEIFEVDRDSFLVGNGASELFMAIVHGLLPKSAYIPQPSFYGYRWVCEAVGAEISDAFFDKTDICFLANPGNPTGLYFPKEELENLLLKCRGRNIPVVLDECFMELSDEPKEHTYTKRLKEFPNLIIVRAFTKSFAIPGIRLGYLMSDNAEYIKRIARQLPEWNVSTLAQRAGLCALKHLDYLEKSRAFIKSEREFLTERLKKRGLEVFDSNTNFLLVFSEKNLYENLLEQGILIRDCSNFSGLKKGHYRMAVKSRKENEILLFRL